MLDAADIQSALEAIMSGKCSTDQIARFLESISERPITADALTAAAGVMRRFSLKLPEDRPAALDTCGTGGDYSGSINVSTLAAIVLASGGVPIAKHGNRSYTGVCGSADLLEGLGVRIDLSPERVMRCLDQTGFGFMFAPLFQPAMRHAAEARKRMRSKTIFNLLGPLANPAGVTYQTVGIYDAGLIPVYLEALRNLGSVRAMVFCGQDGMDEISLSAPTTIGRLDNGAVTTEVFDPLSLGIERVVPQQLKASSREDAIKQAGDILNGNGHESCVRIVALNAAAGFYVKALCGSLEEGYRMARQLLSAGKARQKLGEIIKGPAHD